MKPSLAVAASALLIGVGPGFAESTGPSDPSLETRLKLASEVVELSGGKAQSEAAVRQVYRFSAAVAARSMPAGQARFVGPLQEVMQTEVLKLVPELLNLTVQAYAARLTEVELRDLLAWTKSESGRSIAAKLPAVREQVLTASTPLLVAAMPKIMDKVVERTCEVAKCSPQDRRAITAAMTAALQQRS